MSDINNENVPEFTEDDFFMMPWNERSCDILTGIWSLSFFVMLV